MANGETHTRSKNKVGRPSNYGVAALDLVATVPLPATVSQIAAHLGVDQKTLYNWMNSHPEFLQAVTRRRREADDHVANALYRRALGYEYVEVTTKVEEGGEEGEKVTETTTPKHLPPETKAAQLWLHNRQPGEWQNKATIEITSDHADRVDAICRKLGIE